MRIWWPIIALCALSVQPVQALELTDEQLTAIADVTFPLHVTINASDYTLTDPILKCHKDSSVTVQVSVSGSHKLLGNFVFRTTPTYLNNEAIVLRDVRLEKKHYAPTVGASEFASHARNILGWVADQNHEIVIDMPQNALLGLLPVTGFTVGTGYVSVQFF